jgi:hypothetical protein
LYGSSPSPAWTRLTSIASRSTSSIIVQDSINWNVGDQVIIGPSYSNSNQDEEAVIVAVVNNSITLDRNLLYEHYGDSSLTVTNSYGSLDARSAVGLISRNIKILGDGSNTSSCRIVVNANGSVVFNAVEISGCGSNQSLSALAISSTSLAVNITSSSIHNCTGKCLSVINSSNTFIENNVFYNGYRHLLYVSNAVRFTASNNLMIGANQAIYALHLNARNIQYNDVACLVFVSSTPITH